VRRISAIGSADRDTRWSQFDERSEESRISSPTRDLLLLSRKQLIPLPRS
jgi:hypothetical protein